MSKTNRRNQRSTNFVFVTQEPGLRGGNQRVAARWFLAVFGGIGSHCLALDPALTQGPMGHSKIHFDPEKLIACQRSIEFVTWASRWLEAIPAKMAVLDQLDRASTSVPLNIAEGNAKFTAPDRCRYWDTARGSALECAACLDVLVAKGKVTQEQAAEGKRLLSEIVSLLIGLCKSVAPNRLGEETLPYRTEADDQD